MNYAAILLAKSGDFDLAAAGWRRFTALRPHDFTGYHNLGLMLEWLGNYRESLSAFTEALPLAETSAARQTTLWHIGVAQYNVGNFGEALQFFRSAAELDTTDVSAWGFAAVSAVRLQRHAEAVVLWDKALAIDPEYFAKAQPGERTLYNRSKEASRPTQSTRPPRE